MWHCQRMVAARARPVIWERLITFTRATLMMGNERRPTATLGWYEDHQRDRRGDAAG